MMDDDRPEAEAVEPLPRPADSRAEAFQGVREARRNELAEDYVELIAELIHEHGEARPVDIATRMGVTAPTVAKTLDPSGPGRPDHPRQVSLGLSDRRRSGAGQGMPAPA